MNDKQMTLDELKKQIREFREARGWSCQNLKDCAISLGLEASEVLELFQWVESDEVRNNKKLKEAVGEELADVLWWVVVMADELGMEVAEVFEQKQKKREKKYGLEEFGKEIDKKKKKKAYYLLKARTRGGHPLAEEER